MVTQWTIIQLPCSPSSSKSSREDEQAVRTGKGKHIGSDVYWVPTMRQYQKPQCDHKREAERDGGSKLQMKSNFKGGKFILNPG